MLSHPISTWCTKLPLAVLPPNTGFSLSTSVIMLSSVFWLALSAASIVSGAPVEKRAVIDHDAVVGFAETVPSGTLGQLYLKYKPHLYVVNGCVPFPAVDAAGNTG